MIKNQTARKTGGLILFPSGAYFQFHLKASGILFMYN